MDLKQIRIIAVSSYGLLILETLITIVMTPIFIKETGIAAYGEILALQGILSIFLFLEGGVGTITAQRTSALVGMNRSKRISAQVYAGILFSLIASIIFIIIWVLLTLIIKLFEIKYNILGIKELNYSVYIMIGIAIVQTIIINTLDNVSNALDYPIATKIIAGISNIIGVVISYSYSDGLMIFPTYLLIKNSVAFILLSIVTYYYLKQKKLNKINIKRIIIELKNIAILIKNIVGSKIVVTILTSIEAPFLLMISNSVLLTQYTTTKKAADLIKTLLDRVGGILITPVSKSYAAMNKNEFRKIIVNYWMMGNLILILCVLTYINTNELFVSWWINKEVYAGNTITIYIGIALITSFNSSVMGFMLSSVNQYKKAAKLIGIESIVKIFLMLILGKTFGLEGYIIAGIIVSAVFILIYINIWNKILG
jgi:O-antigen/teichoic acid export membrane protein